MSSQPAPPPRFSSGGGYQGVMDDTIYPNNNDSQEQYHHMPAEEDGYNTHLHHQQQQQHQMMDRLSQEAQLQQRIAQSMLTTPRAANNTTTSEEELFGLDDVPVTFMNPPPWEGSTNTAASRYYDGSAQFPTINHHHNGNGTGMYMMSTTTFPTNEIMNSGNNNAMAIEPPPQVAIATSAVTTTHHSNPANVGQSSTSRGPSSTKSVTFQTHDQYHSWDEQLDQLKHVDEDFFNVAHYLLEVVNVGSVDVNYFDDENGELFFNDDGGYGGGQDINKVTTPVNGADCSGGSILAKIFTFIECGTTEDVLFGGHGGPYHYHQTSNNNNSNNMTSTFGEQKKYKLTKKLVQDFEQAVKYRMENIETNDSLTLGGGLESEVVTRTREIADKIEAYGLPGMPQSHHDGILQQQLQQPYQDGGVGNEDVVAYRDCYDVEYDNEEEEEYTRNFEASNLERRKRNEPRHFPILPTDDEDAIHRGGMSEDERRFYNTFGNIPTLKEIDQKINTQINSQPHLKSVCKIFKTLVGPRRTSSSSAPSKEQCQIRIQQIQREIYNAERMMDSSRSKEVILACVNRINKLKDEDRMYQIFKERYKIQAMMQATESESVKKACSQRLYQVTAELKSIDLDQYDEPDVVLDAGGYLAKATGGEDLDWYERAQQYVRTQEHPNNRRSYHNTAATDGDYRPHMQQYPQQYPSPTGYIPYDENYYDRHYPEKQFASPRRALSPRNGRPYQHGSSPRRQSLTNHYPPY